MKKYQAGGRVSDSSNDDIPEERGPVGMKYNSLLNDLRRMRRRELDISGHASPEFERFIAKTGPSRRGPLRDPDAEDMAVNAGKRSAEARDRIGFNQRIQRNIETALEGEGRRIGAKRYADPSRMEDAGFKRGGQVKKMAKGGAARGDGCAARGKTKGRMV